MVLNLQARPLRGGSAVHGAACAVVGLVVALVPGVLGLVLFIGVALLRGMSADP